MIPYLASARWYAEWLRGLSIGMPAEEAVGLANCAADVYGKDFARCRICGSGGEILLSEAIEGGASRLKRASSLPKLKLSDHGNWRHSHIGALTAAYGRAPYYQHFMPMLEAAYLSEEKSLEVFNMKIHEAILKMLFGNDNPAQMMLTISGSRAAKERGKEIAAEISMTISIIDALMRHGRETLLALTAPPSMHFAFDEVGESIRIPLEI